MRKVGAFIGYVLRPACAWAPLAGLALWAGAVQAQDAVNSGASKALGDLINTNCVECHNADGLGRKPRVRHPGRGSQSARIRRSGKRPSSSFAAGSCLPRRAKQPGQADIDAVVSYLESSVDAAATTDACRPRPDPAPEPHRVRGVGEGSGRRGNRSEADPAHRGRGRRIQQHRRRAGRLAVLHGAVPLGRAPHRAARSRRTRAEDGQGHHSGHASRRSRLPARHARRHAAAAASASRMSSRPTANIASRLPEEDFVDMGLYPRGAADRGHAA